TIADNLAGYGGGIFNWDTLTVTNSTIDNNSASAYNSSTGGWGGGIYNGGTVTVTNSTIAYNKGAGLLVFYNTCTLSNTIVALNTYADIALGYGSVSPESAY